jgi:hypothetical protein
MLVVLMVGAALLSLLVEAVLFAVSEPQTLTKPERQMNGTFRQASEATR